MYVIVSITVFLVKCINTFYLKINTTKPDNMIGTLQYDKGTITDLNFK